MHTFDTWLEYHLNMTDPCLRQRVYSTNTLIPEHAPLFFGDELRPGVEEWSQVIEKHVDPKVLAKYPKKLMKGVKELEQEPQKNNKRVVDDNEKEEVWYNHTVYARLAVHVNNGNIALE